MSDSDYTFIRELGSGSFGTTWLAKNKKTSEKVAIKIFGNISLDAKKKRAAKEDWMHEIKMLKALLKSCFPYAVCVHDTYLEDDIPRLVMDFVDGQSLGQQLDTQWPRSVKQGVILAYDLIKGIQIIHKHGIVHEDIKGDNIIWDKKMKQYRFIDFGLSCQYKTKTVNLATVKFPCGTYGTKYISSPDMEYARYHDPIVPWLTLQSHDYWSIGLELLRWYTLPTTRNYYIKEYEKWSGKKPTLAFINRTHLHSWGPLYYLLDPMFIHSEIEKIPNETVRLICCALLEFNGEERWNNFQEISKLLDNLEE